MTWAAVLSTFPSLKWATVSRKCWQPPGNNRLGGDDFDQRIMDWLVDSFKKEHGIDLKGDKMAMQRI